MIYIQLSKQPNCYCSSKFFFSCQTFHFNFLFWKVLVSSINGQVWHLVLQQGVLLLSKDNAHLILALTKWFLSDVGFLQSVISKNFTIFLVRCQKNVRLIKDILKVLNRRMVGDTVDQKKRSSSKSDLSLRLDYKVSI